MNNIKRKAKIKDIINNKAIVEIESFSACENCALLSSCGSEKCKGYTVEVIVLPEDNFQKGEFVNIEISQRQAFLAVFLSYIMPLILVILTLSISMLITKNEIKSGIYSIIILIPYYLWLFLNRKRIATKFRFNVSKIMD